MQCKDFFCLPFQDTGAETPFILIFGSGVSCFITDQLEARSGGAVLSVFLSSGQFLATPP